MASDVAAALSRCRVADGRMKSRHRRRRTTPASAIEQQLGHDPSSGSDGALEVPRGPNAASIVPAVAKLRQRWNMA
jgi:hypothetical protein